MVGSDLIPCYKLIQDYIVVLVTSKNKEEPNKTEHATEITSLKDFSDTQGQLILRSMVEVRRNLNSFKLLWLSLLPARMKKIQSKMKALSANKIFPIISLLDFFQTLQGS